MREIALDTETTGMDPLDADRIVEIGCVEMENHVPTGKTLQLYLNPERNIPAEATAIHGITDEFVKDKPTFLAVYTEFMDFIKDAKLIIHNAEFDMKFINWELENVGAPPIGWKNVLDTLAIARQKFPGSPANLDALCRRFDIDNTERTYHGALLDSELLAEVYLELLGGRQRGLSLDEDGKKSASSQLKGGSGAGKSASRQTREPRPHCASDAELEAHAELLEKLN